MTALTASSVSGAWDGVSGPAPSGGTWEPTAHSDTAGAYIYCPPPPQSAPQTYGNGSSIDAVNASGYEAEPVNTGTGAYTSTETDAKLAGIGVPFTFTRSYTSSDTASGPLGVGWTDSMNVTATASGTGPGSTVTICGRERGTGHLHRERRRHLQRAHRAPARRSRRYGGGGWTLTRQNQDLLTFNSSGELISEVDRNGVGLTLAYNGTGQLASVTDYAGRTRHLRLQHAGLLGLDGPPPLAHRHLRLQRFEPADAVSPTPPAG